MTLADVLNGWHLDPCLLPAVSFTAEEKLLSRKMMKYWANFARYG
jgi:hypothetical protein